MMTEDDVPQICLWLYSDRKRGRYICRHECRVKWHPGGDEAQRCVLARLAR